MRQVEMPQYLTAKAFDCMLLEGETIALDYHCRGCGAFGNGWVEQHVRGVTGLLCPACGETKGEKL